MKLNDTHELRELNGDEVALVAGGLSSFFVIPGPGCGAVQFPGGSSGRIIGMNGVPLNPFCMIN